MKLAIISDNGAGLGLGMHLSSEGHNVALALSTNSSLGDGLVDKKEAASLNGDIDIFLFDSDNYGKEADTLRKQGRRVLGTSQWAEMIATNPAYAKDIIKLIGWDTEPVANGINLYISSWFNGSQFISTYASLVYKRFMSGGRGPDINFTGVVGNFHQPTEKIYNKILAPLQPILRKVNHRGCFHAHLVINKDTFSVSEISASFNSPLSVLLFENSKHSVADIILRLFDESSKPIVPLDQWAAGVLVTVPPYPYPIPSEPTALKGIHSSALKHLWLIDVAKNGNELISTGLHGKIGYVTARGSFLQEATKRVYRTISNFEIRDLQFRNDVGQNVHNLVNSLKEYGWIK